MDDSRLQAQRIRSSEDPQFWKFIPTLGALLPVPAKSVEMKSNRTVEKHFLYKKTPKKSRTLGFPRKRRPQIDLRTPLTSSKK